MKRWLSLAVLTMITLGLGGCGKTQTPSSGAEPNPTLAAAEERVNQYLAANNITLPAGVSRANLRDVTNGNATGVATKEIVQGKTTITILADLPEPGAAHYAGWLIDATGTAIALGQLTPEKGGWVVEKTTTNDWSSYPTVVVSQETKTGIKPTQRVLEGDF